MNPILVTGGLGFIGSHTVVELLAQGREVLILDNLSNSTLDVLDGIEKIAGVRPAFAKVDLRDKTAIASALEGKQLDGVIHFAAAKSVSESLERPLYYYENNISALVNLLQVLSDQKSCKFIFSSSCTVYGEPDSLPITEDAPVKPAITPYGYSKQVGEQLLRDAVAANENMRTVLLRYFNPIGAHASGHIGELPQGVPQNLIPYLTQTAAGERESLSIFGTDYDTADGTAVRDYIHVVDLARAHIAALDAIAADDSEPIQLYNVGTGQGTSVREIVTTFENCCAPVAHEYTDRRPGDIMAIYAGTEKAEQHLGWKATHSLEDSLKSAWKWQQKLSAR